MKSTSKLKQICHYLWDKKSEVTSLDEKDILLSKLVMDIHRTRSHSNFVRINLFNILPVHPINRPNSLKDTQKRITTLEAKRQKICRLKHLNRAQLHQYLPSISAIKVVRDSDHNVIAFEGCGRLLALQAVFSADDQLTLEVQEYHFNDPASILHQMQNLRRLHQLDS